MASKGDDGQRFALLSEAELSELETDLYKDNTVRTKAQFVKLFEQFLAANNEEITPWKPTDEVYEQRMVSRKKFTEASVLECV